MTSRTGSKTLRILITGSRDCGEDHQDRIVRAIRGAVIDLGGFWRPVLIVHGDARGADSIARDSVPYFANMGYEIDHEAHPADWNNLGKKAGPARNAKMVKLGADICLAFPLDGSIGTWDCVTRAIDARIPVNYWAYLKEYV